MKKTFLTAVMLIALFSCGKKENSKAQANSDIKENVVAGTAQKNDIKWDLTTKNGLKVKFIKAKDKVQAENKTADMVIALVKRGYNVDHTETQYLSKDKMYVGIIYVNPKLKATPEQIKAVNGVK